MRYGDKDLTTALSELDAAFIPGFELSPRDQALPPVKNTLDEASVWHKRMSTLLRGVADAIESARDDSEQEEELSRVISSVSGETSDMQEAFDQSRQTLSQLAELERRKRNAAARALPTVGSRTSGTSPREISVWW